MSEKPSESESQLADDESDGSNVESWLRKAARVPDGDGRLPLPQPGQVISGKYRIEEQLGKGGMGAVYRATHVVSDKQVALKWMLRPASDERAKERFTREARAAGRIDHPNVVDVYDIGQDGDAGYLVMELLRGESLRQYLARGPMSPTTAADLLVPAMRGVAAAHREGVIHRDLKPDNIFLCRAPDGEAREAKVLDFGISTVSTLEPDGKTTLTKEGTVLGTPSYMSPEQLESVRNADARTDVYAFGVILYEALTSSVPFVGDSYSALVIAIANTKPRPPRELRPEIPVELERVVMLAIEKNREQRIQSMDALVAALLPFTSVKSAGSGEHVSIEMQRATVPSARRRFRSVTTGVLLAIAVLSALSWWALHDRSPVTASNPAVSPDKPSTVSAAEPARPTPTPAAAVPAQPSVQAGANGAQQEAQPPAAQTAPEPRAEPSPAASGRAPHAARSARVETQSPSVPPPAPQKAAASAHARSGSIGVDDL